MWTTIRVGLQTCLRYFTQMGAYMFISWATFLLLIRYGWASGDDESAGPAAGGAWTATDYVRVLLLGALTLVGCAIPCLLSRRLDTRLVRAQQAIILLFLGWDLAQLAGYVFAGTTRGLSHIPVVAIDMALLVCQLLSTFELLEHLRSLGAGGRMSYHVPGTNHWFHRQSTDAVVADADDLESGEEEWYETGSTFDETPQLLAQDGDAGDEASEEEQPASTEEELVERYLRLMDSMSIGDGTVAGTVSGVEAGDGDEDRPDWDIDEVDVL